MKRNDGDQRSRRHFLEAAGVIAAAWVAGTLPHGARAASSAEAPLKIGVIGSGRIGGTLGTLWLKSGHEVMFSSRHLEHDKELAQQLGGKARAGTTKEAAAFGDVLLIAVPYSALPEVGRELGNLLKGKVVIDACNPIPRRDGDIANWARQKGAGLASAELLPGARIVRAFNAIGYSRLPDFAERKGSRSGMPIAGDDRRAIATASRLIRDVGLEPVVIGPLAKGKYLMPGTALAGERTPEEIRKIAATLD